MQQSAHEELPTSELVDARGEQFRLLSVVGRGGMGTVYKAEQVALGRIVALKLLPVRVTERTVVQKMILEGKALAKLTHPNIISIYSVSSTQDTNEPFLVLEYFESQTLAELIRQQRRLDADRTFAIFDQILSGLSAAHKSGIIHRDLKPDNILIGENNRVKIADFGIAKILRSDEADRKLQNLTATGHLSGTPTYMSPEQCRGEKLDERSDIYSIGCMLFHALSGAVPFDASAPMEAMYKQLFEESPLLPDACDVRLQPIIDRALEKSPEKRFQSADELRACLQSVMNEKPVAGKSVSREHSRELRAVKQRKHSSIRRTVAVTLIGLLSLVIAGSCLFCYSATPGSVVLTVPSSSSQVVSLPEAIAAATRADQPFRNNKPEITSQQRQTARQAATTLISAINKSRDKHDGQLRVKAYELLFALQDATQDPNLVSTAQELARHAIESLPPGSENLIDDLEKSGTILRENGHLSEALDIYRRAELECSKVDPEACVDPPAVSLARIRSAEAVLWFKQGKYVHSAEVAREALKNLDSAGAKPWYYERIILRNTLAEDLVCSGNPQAAATVLKDNQRALNLSPNPPNSAMGARVQYISMAAYAHMGDVAQEQDAYQQLMQVCRDSDNLSSSRISVSLRCRHAINLFNAHEETAAFSLLSTLLADALKEKIISDGSYASALMQLHAAREACRVSHERARIPFAQASYGILSKCPYVTLEQFGGDPQDWVAVR